MTSPVYEKQVMTHHLQAMTHQVQNYNKANHDSLHVNKSRPDFYNNIVITHFLSTCITILVMTYQVQNNNKTSHDL